MAKFVFCLTASLLFSLALGKTVQSSPAEIDFEGNHYGSCVCQQNCQNEDVLREFQQLEKRVQSLGQSQTEQSQVLEKKIESLREENQLKTLEVNARQRLQQLLTTIDRLEENVVSKIEEQQEVFMDKINASAETQTKQIEMLEKKIDSLLEQLGVPSNPPCPPTFTYDSDSKICIKLYKDRRSWPAADNFCRDLGDGYRLAVLDTDNKFQFVQNFLLGSGLQRGGWTDQCWVGAKKQDGEGRWLWSTGDEVLQGWGPGQPDNYVGVENCLLLAYRRGWTAWMFNDGPCTTSLRRRTDLNFQSICEYQLN